ncbi:hypothetical protein H9Q73_014408, partial [Fusarium xylarioides]
MPAMRNSLQPYDQAYCTTSHDLDTAIGPVLWSDDNEELEEIRTIAAAIRKNISSRSRSFLVGMVVFECSMI